MLFRKKIERSCAYCAHGTALDEQQVLCSKRGICTLPNKCGKFRYDPTKRIPTRFKALDLGKYKEEDFKL